MKKCLLFPGQGAHNLHMLDKIKTCQGFSQKYKLICEITNSNPLKEIVNENSDYICQNIISSLLTVLVSSISLEQYLLENKEPDFVAGYSVGQWTALYAGGCISFEKLIEIIKVRAEFMDSCNISGGMVAIIGVKEEPLQELCQKITKQGYFIAISNYNCVGQYTVAGTTQAIALIEEEITLLKPKKVFNLPVSGPWHCELLQQATDLFEKHLKSIELLDPKYPIMDNVCGDFLPKNINKHKHLLASHISSPIRWISGIQRLLDCGCNEFIEIGYGNVLSKFGFFIKRQNISHKNFLI